MMRVVSSPRNERKEGEHLLMVLMLVWRMLTRRGKHSFWRMALQRVIVSYRGSLAPLEASSSFFNYPSTQFTAPTSISLEMEANR